MDEKKTKLTSKHDNKTFYFCSASCKATFDKDPHKHGRVQVIEETLAMNDRGNSQA